MVFLALLAYAMVFKLIYDSKTMRQNIQAFEARKFRVLDGSVHKIQVNNSTPGACNVLFISSYGQECKRWFLAREEGLETGSPLLLVTADKNAVKKDVTWTFTPFMMSEEGSKLHW